MSAEKIREELILIAKHRMDMCKDLVSLALEQREILTGGRHIELEENAEKHEPIIVELARLDQREKTLLPELDRDQTDKSAITDFERKRKKILAQTGDEAKKLKSLVETNAELLGNAMNYVSFSMGLLSKLATDQPSYDPRGESAASSAIVLDLKV